MTLSAMDYDVHFLVIPMKNKIKESYKLKHFWNLLGEIVLDKYKAQVPELIFFCAV